MRLVPAVLLCAVLLSGCGSSPQADLNRALTTVTDQANGKNAVGLREAVGQLIVLVDRQQTGNDLTADKADRIRAQAQKVLADAALLDVPVITPTPTRTTTPPSPTPTPSAKPSETPSATPGPTPSPTPSPTHSAGPTPTPTPTRSEPATPSSEPATPSPTKTKKGGKGDASTPPTSDG